MAVRQAKKTSGRKGTNRRESPASSISKTRVDVENSSLSDRVYRALKRDLITGVFQPGEALTEKVLAERYKGSRTPVREAAVKLQHEHLLRIVPNRGYFVTHITLQQLNQIYEFRAAVECAAVELAARKILNDELMERLTELANTRYTIDDRASYEHFIAADTEFHLGLARLSGNHMLVRAVDDARCQMERIMYAAIDIGYYGELPGREHRGILDAVARRDANAARQLMFDHIFGSRDKVLKLAGNQR